MLYLKIHIHTSNPQSIIMSVKYTLRNVDESKVNIKKYQKENVEYEILHLNKDTYEKDDVENSIFRTVIRDLDGKILSFGPPKSVSNEYFRKKYMELTSENLQINEAIEGTMVNLFYDERIESWEISTRTAISGNYWWTYKPSHRKPEANEKIMQTTFRTMFLQTMGYPENTSFNDVLMFNKLPKDHIYSFTFQHPSNKIVVPVEYARIYLVAVYRKVDFQSVQLVPLNEVKAWDNFANSYHLVLFPTDLSELNTYESIYQHLDAIQYLYKGIMITDIETGTRTCIMSKDYEEMRQLIGNEKNQEYRSYLQYRYYILKYSNQFQTYIENFHNSQLEMFNDFQKQESNLIQKIQKRYRMKHDPVYRDAPSEFIAPHTYGEKSIPKHIERLHRDFYIASKQRGEKKNITTDVVGEYFNSLSPLEQWLALQPLKA